MLVCFSALSASAQVTGTFFPTAVGEIQEPGVTPFPQVGQVGVSVGDQQMTQLEFEANRLRCPYINLCSSYANQSLLTRPGQMDSFTPEIAEFGFYPTLKSEVKFSYIPTIFGTAGLKAPNEFGQEYRGAFRYQPTNRLKLRGQLGIYEWAQTEQTRSGVNVLGAFNGTYAINDRLHFTAGFRRDILGSSLLATTGLNLPFTNTLVGRVSQNLFFGILDYRPFRKTTVSLSYGGGTEVGSDIQTNPFQTGSLTIGQGLYQSDVRRHLSGINFTYQFLVSSWKYDLANIGNAVLQIQQESPSTTEQIIASSKAGQTQVPASANIPSASAGGFLAPSSGGQQAGVGGYFSPQAFIINSWGLSAAGRVSGPVYYRGGAGVAIGQSKTPFTSLGLVSFGGFANAAITARVGKNMIMEQGWYFLQGAESYRRQVLYSQCKFFVGAK